jgi:intracellular sulfur oxidation DsrE/DsrF family protein
MSNVVSGTPRRGFLGSMAVGAATLVLGRLSTADAEVGALMTLPPVSDAWLARLTGKNKQVFDCTSPNEGWGAVFGLTFIDTTKSALKLTDKDVNAVIVYRHFSMPLMLNDSIWAKYKVGELIGVKDPKTNAPATRNIFRDNVPMHPGLTYEQAMAKNGLIMVACNMALTVLSGMAAPKANVTPEAAKTEWTAGVLPGVSLAPSGVYAVNRAQQAGCSYAFGG